MKILFGCIVACVMFPLVSISASTDVAPPDERLPIYLTFDDGPTSRTLLYLDLLAEYNAKATFFTVGPLIEANPDIMLRIIEEGHAVGNHTWSHPHLTVKSDTVIRNELRRSQEAFLNVLGFEPTCFRPPYGATNARVHRIQIEEGLGNISWSPNRPNAYQVNKVGAGAGTWDVDTNDWKQNPNIVRDELQDVQPYDVVLMHDINLTALQPLKEWLEINHEQYRFESLPGCGTNVFETTIEWRCNQQTATIIGTNNNDTIHGTNKPDVIVGLGGNDIIYGLDGNDIICGGDGNDIIAGGKHDDIIYGEKGADRISGNKGADILYGGNGGDRIYGHAGADTIYGGNKRDVIYGDKGNDVIYGEAGSDRIRGGDHDDVIYGGTLNETHIDIAKDYINGNNGTDSCFNDVKNFSCE